LLISEEPAHETYRVIVLGRNGTEILLSGSDAGLHFPQVTIPRWQRVAENVAIAMKKRWEEEIICLFELDSPLDRQRGYRYVTTTHWRNSGRFAVPLKWISISDLSENSFAEPADYLALRNSLDQCGATVRDGAQGPFARPSWFPELCKWIEAVVVRKEFHLNGNFRQLNASPGFSLIRFETDGPAVWFKAVGEPNEREFPITLTLARLFPRYIPQILAARPAWNGWLMSEAQGTSLAETTDRSFWETAAGALAKLQIESMNSQREIVDCGPHDLTIGTLRDLTSPFMCVMAQLMKKQSKVPPAVLGEMELGLLEECLHDTLSLLRDLGIPNTLGHLDLNPGNLIVSESRCLFLDWAEAYVGHPFFTFQYLLEHLRRVGGADSLSEEGLIGAYLAPWEQVLSRNCVAEAIVLMPLLAVLAYAVGTGTWAHPERIDDPKIAGYLRSLMRRMNREAQKLSERRSPCLR
jgi:hypothetical protein